MTDAQNELSAKLDTLIRLVALGVCGDRPQVEKIAILSASGLQPRVIAEILGTTSNTVSVALSGLRKHGRANRRSNAGGVVNGA